MLVVVRVRVLREGGGGTHTRPSRAPSPAKISFFAPQVLIRKLHWLVFASWFPAVSQLVDDQGLRISQFFSVLSARQLFLTSAPTFSLTGQDFLPSPFFLMLVAAAVPAAVAVVAVVRAGSSCFS